MAIGCVFVGRNFWFQLFLVVNSNSRRPSCCAVLVLAKTDKPWRTVYIIVIGNYTIKLVVKSDCGRRPISRMFFLHPNYKTDLLEYKIWNIYFEFWLQFTKVKQLFLTLAKLVKPLMIILLETDNQIFCQYLHFQNVSLHINNFLSN